MMKFSASIVLHPGLVFIPDILTQNEQQCLANIENLELIRSKNRIRMLDKHLPRCIPSHCQEKRV